MNRIIFISIFYMLDEKEIFNVPTTKKNFKRLAIEYKTFPGWEEDIADVRSFEELPKNAQQYVADLLENATKVYIQNDPSSGIRGTYGRHLGLVWADDVLVNYMVVKMGYSQNNYADEDQGLVFNGISLDQWFKNAESYAQENNLGMWA